jgi:hypothetical protein
MRFYILPERMEIKFSKVGDRYEYPYLLFLFLYTVYRFTLVDVMKKETVGSTETLVALYQATGLCGRSTGTYTNLGDLQRDLMGVKSHPTK